MNGKLIETGLREKSGSYQQIFHPAPLTQEQKKEAIKRAKNNLKLVRERKSDFLATCGCCDQSYAIPSEVLNISKEGVCAWCSMALSDKVKYCVLHRKPTIGEIIDRHNEGLPLSPLEGHIAVETLKTFLSKGENNVEKN